MVLPYDSFNTIIGIWVFKFLYIFYNWITKCATSPLNSSCPAALACGIVSQMELPENIVILHFVWLNDCPVNLHCETSLAKS